MKNKIYKTLIYTSISIFFVFFSCNDFLDKAPLSSLSPEGFFKNESDLEFYLNRYYQDNLPSHSDGPNGIHSSSNPVRVDAWQYGAYGMDKHTDNQCFFSGPHNQWIPGELRVPETGGEWNFSMLYNFNYFFNKVLPLWENREITGSAEKINHYIGEMYFLRAHWYFAKLQYIGDFPIIEDILPDQLGPLTESCKRAPRNEVARFILKDLDKAIGLLMEVSPDGKKQRISRYCAYLLKSRVALFEGTWLKYFKGTAWVPNGQGWPGKEKDYNANYQFPSGSIDGEISFFLQQAMDAAANVADNVPLVLNTGNMRQSFDEPENPYELMFGDVDMSRYSEVLLWRQYSLGLNLIHAVPLAATRGNHGVGMLRGLIQAFLMENGLPIYAPESGYAGDDMIADVRNNRDGRLQLFLVDRGQRNIFNTDPLLTHALITAPWPNITTGQFADCAFTGYYMRKGLNGDATQGGNGNNYNGSITFRSVEANLNYIEACYEKNGSLDGKAYTYWREIRERAKVDPDFNKTIQATNMNIEGETDWGAYSAGTLIDPFLFNIRRERRCELFGDGLRMMDLKRWRALDQMIPEGSGYHIEGFKLWGSMQANYSNLSYGLEDADSNVSPPERSDYLRPFEKTSRSLVIDGYRWRMSHYLSPIPFREFLLTSEGNDVTTSPIYQNPNWPIKANDPPIDYLSF